MKTYAYLSSAIILMILSAYTMTAQKTDPTSQAKELGAISWYRDYSDAMIVSEKTGKPVMILFQEVPGCSTCQKYGKNVLSNPLLVDIIENEYIPLAIYNNKGGEDAKVLKKYNEPTWNNPVVRVVNSDGKDIITRLAGNYSVDGLASYIRTSLTVHQGKIPEYANLITEELSTDTKRNKQAYFSMYCFWTGEAALGDIDGVVSTSPGFMNGKEVVEVNYNPEKVSMKEISSKAKRHKFSFVKDPSKFRIDKDPQYHLKRSLYKYLPLSELQRTKINSAIANKANPDQFLSPTQLSWKQSIEKSGRQKDLQVLYDKPIDQAWREINIKA